MIIVTHKEDCAIVTEGPTFNKPVGLSDYQAIPEPCTCGGELLKVELLQKFDRTRWTAVVSPYQPE